METNASLSFGDILLAVLQTFLLAVLYETRKRFLPKRRPSEPASPR